MEVKTKIGGNVKAEVEYLMIEKLRSKDKNAQCKTHKMHNLECGLPNWWATSANLVPIGYGITEIQRCENDAFFLSIYP